MYKSLTTISQESTHQEMWKRRGPKSGRDIVCSAWKHAAVRYGRGWFIELSRTSMSVDLVLGLPTNIAGYAILCHLFGKVTGLRPVEIIGNLGNCHIYQDHFSGVELQLQREPILWGPKFHINGDIRPDLYDVDPAQLVLTDYKCHPAIKFKMSV